MTHISGRRRLLVSMMHFIRLAINRHAQTETLQARALNVWTKDIVIADMLSLEIIFLWCLLHRDTVHIHNIHT